MDMRIDGGLPGPGVASQLINADALVELNHRVANSLQLVATFLRLQEREISDESAREAIRTAATRVSAIGLVQRAMLYIKGEEIDFAPFLRSFCAQLSVSTGMTIALSTDDVRLPTATVENLAIVINELVINAAKYAYGGLTGAIDISCKRLGRRCLIVTIADQGRGLPEGPHVTSSPGVGMKIMNAAIEAIDGSLTFESGDGAKATLRIPLHPLRDNRNFPA